MPSGNIQTSTLITKHSSMGEADRESGRPTGLLDSVGRKHAGQPRRTGGLRAGQACERREVPEILPKC